jgi:hypothetical protein
MAQNGQRLALAEVSASSLNARPSKPSSRKRPATKQDINDQVGPDNAASIYASEIPNSEDEDGGDKYYDIGEVEDNSASIAANFGVSDNDLQSFQLGMTISEVDDDLLLSDDNDVEPEDDVASLHELREFTRIRLGTFGFNLPSPEEQKARKTRLAIVLTLILTISQTLVQEIFSTRRDMDKWPLNPRFMGRLACGFLLLSTMFKY